MVVEITKSEEQAADIFTKYFPTGKAKDWNNNLRLIGTLNAPYQRLPPRPTKATKENAPAAPGCSSRGLNRTLIEFCCGPDSKLGQDRAAASGCNVVRVTEKEDATTEACKNMLLGLIRNLRRVGDHPIFLFASIPCTGGSAWQNLNRKKPGGEARLAYHRRIFKKIWAMFECVAMEVMSTGIGWVAIEWPRGCAYWKFPRVAALVKDLNLMPAKTSDR